MLVEGFLLRRVRVQHDDLGIEPARKIRFPELPTVPWREPTSGVVRQFFQPLDCYHSSRQVAS